MYCRGGGTRRLNELDPVRGVAIVRRRLFHTLHHTRLIRDHYSLSLPLAPHRSPSHLAGLPSPERHTRLHRQHGQDISGHLLNRDHWLLGGEASAQDTQVGATNLFMLYRCLIYIPEPCRISNGNARNPGIWIDGGMHAREWISPATVTFIANQLAEGWDDLPEHMRNINWYIHPVANPDGYEYSHTTDRLWRKNMRAHGRQCPGVDLNRNFGYKWGGKGTSASPCSQTYRGSKAFSEPETFYISKFISGFPRETFQAYLSFHSYGQYILYPWGYDYHLTKDRADLDRVARQAGTVSQLSPLK